MPVHSRKCNQILAFRGEQLHASQRKLSGLLCRRFSNLPDSSNASLCSGASPTGKFGDTAGWKVCATSKAETVLQVFNGFQILLRYKTKADCQSSGTW
jgi:hypothetical protein